MPYIYHGLNIQSIVDVNEYPIRENPYIFNISINLQINEIYTDKHLNMLLPEFLEAISRAIDKASPYPPGDNKDDWPMEKRQSQHLVDKLENVLPIMMKLITHPDYKLLRDKFPIPTKDLSTGLYMPDFENQFYQGYIIKPTIKPKGLELNNNDIIDNDNDNKEKKEENDGNKIIEEEKKDNIVNEENNLKQESDNNQKEKNEEIINDENNKDNVEVKEENNENNVKEEREEQNENEKDAIKDDKGEIVNDNANDNNIDNNNKDNNNEIKNE